MRTALVLCLALVACGGAPASPGPATPAGSTKPIATAPASRAPLFVEVVSIHQRWVEKFVPATPADAQAWKEAPTESFQHLLIKGTDATARKKAQALLDRVKKGEDLGKLARENSEDFASRETGGEYAADRVEKFVEPVREAYAKLKVGEVAPALVESKHGLHIVKKTKPSEEVLLRAYKTAKAPEHARKLAVDLIGRFRAGAESRPAISDAVTAILGEIANSDEKRPKPAVMEREQLKQVHLPAEAKAALERFADGAKAGEVLGDPIVVERSAETEPIVLVARAASQPE